MKTLVAIVIVLLIGVAVFFMQRANTPSMMPSPMGMSTSTMATSSETTAAIIPKPCATSSEPLFPLAHTVDTSDWETFRDEVHGIEFKYPRGWHIGERDFIETYVVDVRSNNDIGYDFDLSIVHIYKPITDAILSQRGGGYVCEEQVRFHERDAIRISHRNPYLSYNHYSYVFEHNGSTIVIRGENADSGEYARLAERHAILDSWKFLR